MKKTEQVYRDILYNAIEKRKRTMTQSEIAKKLKISLSTVNHALAILRKMNAIKVNPQNFTVVNPKKILYYWACIRNIEKDVIYKTRAEKPITQIERLMPDTIIYTAYSAYKFKFRDVPADYSEVYIYAEDLKEVKKRFPKNDKTPNLFVIKKDENNNYGKTATIANIYVDLWNIKEWYAKDFIKAMEARLNAVLE